MNNSEPAFLSISPPVSIFIHHWLDHIYFLSCLRGLIIFVHLLPRLLKFFAVVLYLFKKLLLFFVRENFKTMHHYYVLLERNRVQIMCNDQHWRNSFVATDPMWFFLALNGSVATLSFSIVKSECLEIWVYLFNCNSVYFSYDLFSWYHNSFLQCENESHVGNVMSP